MPNSTQTTPKTPSKVLSKVPSTVAKKSTTKSASTPLTRAATKTLSKASSKSPVKTRQVVPASKKMVTKTAIIKTAVPAVKALITKPIKTKKIKLIRDSFTIPKPEYLILDNLKLRATDLKHPVKKSELLRAGIKALAAMTDTQLLLALKAVPMLKTGRPSK